MRGFGVVCWLLLVSSGVSAQAPDRPPAHAQQADVKTDATPGPHALEASDLAPFFDGIVPLQLERSDVAGASVLLMQDGAVLLEKGYGFADLKSRKPVDPATTIFRLASISKLFTWVSVMQLAEQGKLDIDSDINRYLDFQVPPAFSRPITLRDLMTHTGGFEDEGRDIIVTNPKQTVSLRDFLIRNQPMRIFPPGTIPAYSNYGVGLAGYIVQRMSGEPFEQYVEQHIFAPLNMEHSTFYQPPPAPLLRLPSEGYPTDTQKSPIGFEIFNPAPAGGVSSTAADMGHFGQALLNGGELDGHRILKPETVAAMWTPQFRASDQLPPIGMGFYQVWRNNLRWIGHEGDLVAFHSLFMLEPSQKLLLFISYNSAGGGERTRPEIIDMFTDRYFPGQTGQSFVAFPRKELEDIEGVYQSTRREESGKVKLLSLLSQRGATVDKEGVLHIEDIKDLRHHPVKWKPIGKDLWQEIDGQRRVFAIRDQGGQVVRLAYDFPGVQAQRVPWYEHQGPVLSAVGASLAVLILVVLAPLIRLGRRLILRRRPPLEPRPGTHWLPLTTQLAAGLWVVLLVALGICVLVLGGEDTMPPTTAWDKYFVLLNVLTAVAIALSLGPVISAIRICRDPALRKISMVKYSLVGLACVVLCWFAIHWHILGPVKI
jgi:CubicO group peptidase (beta-lactamase class C family)